MDTEEGSGDRMNWEIEIAIYTLLCIKEVTNENLLQSTGNSVLTEMREKSKKEGLYVHISLIHFTVQRKLI